MPGFGEGFGTGLEQGARVRQIFQALAAQKREDDARKALSAYLLQTAQGGQPGAQPGQPGMPPQGPQNVALPGATNMPKPTVPPGPQVAPGGPAMPTGGPPPGPPPQPAPPGLGAGKQPVSGANLSGTAQDIQDPTERAKANLQAVARQIAQANPGRKWKPTELLDTIDAYVKELDAFNPMEKMYMQALLAGSKAQTQYILQNMRDTTSKANTQTRADVAERGQNLTHQDRQASLAERIRSDTFNHEDRGARTAIYAQAVSDTHEDRQAAIQAANDRNDANLAEKLQALDQAIQDKDWATVARIQAQEFSAQTANAPAGKGPPAPKIAPPPAGHALARPGAAAAPAPPKVGETRNGYRYKGGDPAKPSSWQKVQ